MDHEIVAMWVWTISYAVAVGCIVWVLWSMRQDGKRRDREIDAMAAGFREQAADFDRMLERQAEALRQPGKVLAELLRRTA